MALEQPPDERTAKPRLFEDFKVKIKMNAISANSKAKKAGKNVQMFKETND